MGEREDGMSRVVKAKPKLCGWCHGPLVRGECWGCDPHRHDRAVKRKHGHRKYPARAATEGKR